MVAVTETDPLVVAAAAYLNKLKCYDDSDPFSGSCTRRYWVTDDAIAVALGESGPSMETVIRIEALWPGLEHELSGPGAQVLMTCGGGEWVGESTYKLRPYILLLGPQDTMEAMWGDAFLPEISLQYCATEQEAHNFIRGHRGTIALIFDDTGMPEIIAGRVAHMLQTEVDFYSLVLRMKSGADVDRYQLRSQLRRQEGPTSS